MTDGELDTVLIQTDCIQKAADIRVNNQAFQLELKFSSLQSPGVFQRKAFLLQCEQIKSS